jgi:hypothetical protein
MSLADELKKLENLRWNGTLTEEEFAAVESDVFERIREIKARTQPQDVIIDDEHRVAGVEITVDDEA